jgi:hypothetical protein
MENMTFISWAIGIFSVLLLALILRLKKTDPVFGCKKFKHEGCKKVSGRDCDFPDCESMKKYSSCI